MVQGTDTSLMKPPLAQVNGGGVRIPDYAVPDFPWSQDSPRRIGYFAGAGRKRFGQESQQASSFAGGEGHGYFHDVERPLCKQRKVAGSIPAPEIRDSSMRATAQKSTVAGFPRRIISPSGNCDLRRWRGRRLLQTASRRFESCLGVT